MDWLAHTPARGIFAVVPHITQARPTLPPQLQEEADKLVEQLKGEFVASAHKKKAEAAVTNMKTINKYKTMNYETCFASILDNCSPVVFGLYAAALCFCFCGSQRQSNFV